MIDLAAAAALISRYAHAMDAKNFGAAASVFGDPVAIDYSAVGGPKALMRPGELEDFLSRLLGRRELTVHTMIGQVTPSLTRDGAAAAYYSVRHFQTSDGVAKHFSLVGWYEVVVSGDRVTELTIVVQATEGDPSILG